MNQELRKIIIYTDGGSRNNPGIAGAGAVIADEKGNVLKEISEFLGVRTNNWAEYQAIILGLQAVKKIFGKEKLKEMEVEVKTDSELVARQLSGKYQIKEESLFPQFIKVWNMRVSDIPNLTLTHIPREKNKKADELANKAMDKGENKQKTTGTLL
ncbi:MAG: ribonuclease HI family protein [Parcubacteria group bacterium]|nr:ribonuclease HI family protein [Parcubacteria group bacterium]